MVRTKFQITSFKNFLLHSYEKEEISDHHKQQNDIKEVLDKVQYEQSQYV